MTKTPEAGKHTPGSCIAWRPVDQTMRGMVKGCKQDIAIRDTEKNLIYGVLYGGFEEASAAQNVFLAAPDLLEALEGVIRVADRQTVEFDAARKAIAKARVHS